MLNDLSAISPVFGNWIFLGRTKGTPLAGLSEADVAALIAQGVSREDDGTPFLQAGYRFGASNGLKNTGRGIRLSIHVSNTLADNFFINTVHLMTEPLNEENWSVIDSRVLKPAMLAIARTWGATWCGTAPWGIGEFEPRRSRPWFGLEWMTYLSPRFAPMVTPPRSAIVERLASGGLLMMATEERFETKNPSHLSAARDIEAALAPINALPWPPDANDNETNQERPS
jgi:Immunity protein 52